MSASGLVSTSIGSTSIGGSTSRAEDMVRSLAQLANISLDDDVEILDERFYNAVLSGGSLALGETFMRGWWRPRIRMDELASRIGQAHLAERVREQSWIQQGKLLWNYLYLKTSSSLEKIWVNWGIQNSKQVATEHYDLGNELYHYMLDDSMNYSCGYFKRYQEQLNAGDRVDLIEHTLGDLSNNVLEEAQVDKMELIRLKLQLKPGQRVLDLGCGWGALANYLATKSRVTVEGITISSEQIEYARQRYCSSDSSEEEEDSGRYGKGDVSFFLDDYRNLLKQPAGQYDAVVSVGMFEHVNPPHYPEYMKIVHHVLKPGGIFLLHTIGGNVSKLVGDPWITKYIFPHSCLPSMAQLTASTERLFTIEDVHNIGPHYDLTLQCWFHNFKDNFNLINGARIENGRNPLDIYFHRMWEYYLLMCAGMFRSRQCQLYQVVLTKDRLGTYQRPNY